MKAEKDKKRGAPVGNTNAIKLKELSLQQEAYRQYCAHIAQGKSKEGWKFLNPQDPLKSLTYKTMEKYIEENPIEFPSILMEMAYADSFRVFEEEGMKLMKGQYRNGSPETWKTFMRNKFNWDKESVEAMSKCAADRILEEIRNRNPEKMTHYHQIKSGKR